MVGKADLPRGVSKEFSSFEYPSPACPEGAGFSSATRYRISRSSLASAAFFSDRKGNRCPSHSAVNGENDFIRGWIRTYAQEPIEDRGNPASVSSGTERNGGQLSTHPFRCPREWNTPVHSATHSSAFQPLPLRRSREMPIPMMAAGGGTLYSGINRGGNYSSSWL